MKLLLVSLLLLFVAVQAGKNVPKICHIAGDPHITTFDGISVDFQGIGLYQIAKNDFVNVQTEFRRCTETMSCVRASAVKLSNENGQVTVRFGSFDARPAFPATDSFPATPATDAVVDPIVINGAEISGCKYDGSTSFCQVSDLVDGAALLGGQYFVSSNADNNGVTIRSREENGLQLVTGKFSLTLSLPYGEESIGTNGLCGFLDGSPSVELVNNNFEIVVDTELNVDYAGDNVNAWALTFAVGDAIAPLLNEKHGVASVGGAFIPNAADQLALSKVQFANFEAMQAADSQCSKMNADNQKVYDNCMYDFAAAGSDPSAAAFAQSNNFAAMTAANINAQFASSSSASSSTSGALIALVVVGVIAAISVVGAIVMVMRLRSSVKIARNISSSALNEQSQQ